MTGVAYIVRCQYCGVARKSYNDPRRGISVIECKRPCGNSHYHWSYIQTIPESEVWPLPNGEESAIPVYVPPTHPPPASPSSSLQGSSSTTHPGDGLPSNKKELQFSSEGRGSMVRSAPTSAVSGAQEVSSPCPGNSHLTPAAEEAKARRPTAAPSMPKPNKSRQQQRCALQ
ncbi:hypothetical protein GH5_03676 [Leishmania sp. Ghana 2012 LV757]|uniref:hypothetical protein n=1 Tax=Leishmania sp. Ghana 2012 LV757 TaxID=2803181 RepID=UPI001B720EBD|nr:hypothetical protein GH5_03676 [Leishmania sp. Ghana 2012 LV757]